MSRLQLSVLTSACAVGILDPVASPLLSVYGEIDLEIASHRLGPTGVEFYLAMEPDLPHLANQPAITSGSLTGVLPPNSNRPVNAVEILGAMLPQQLERSADLINRVIRSRDSDRTIVAVATFFPEISRSNEMGYPARQQAVNALANSLRLAAILNRDFKHRIAALEAVTGSRIRILEKTEDADPLSESDKGSQHTIALDRPEVVRERLIGSLADAWSQLDGDPLKEFAPPVALELEPGPCFLLQDEHSLTELAGLLDGTPTLNGLVGFNLDIAHFRIANVSLDAVCGVHSIRDRILHAHVSGHHRCAHFGDGVIEADDEGEIRRWLKFLTELWSAADRERRTSKGLAQFSGYVSLELEATRCAADVIESARRISGWIP